eukprot:938833-Prymnesium_polylepis.4
MGTWLYHTSPSVISRNLPHGTALHTRTNDLTMSSERCKTHRVRLPLATLPLLVLLSGGLT